MTESVNSEQVSTEHGTQGHITYRHGSSTEPSTFRGAVARYPQRSRAVDLRPTLSLAAPVTRFGGFRVASFYVAAFVLFVVALDRLLP